MEFTPEEYRKLREDLCLTQAEMAEKVGVNPKTYSEWELGKATPRPSHKRILRELDEQRSSGAKI